jgi:integrase
MKGVHRNARIVDGKRTEYGCYRIQVTTRFSECKRLQLTTSIFPDTKDKDKILLGMKKMLKELSRTGDKDRLIGLQNRSLKLIDVYTAWLDGRERLLVGNEGNNLLEELERYMKSGLHAEATIIRSRATIEAWKKYSLLNDKNLVRELPAILQKAYIYYGKHKKPDMFNNARQYFLGFIKSHLMHSTDSPIYSSVKKIEKLRVVKRKDHHPFSTPHDFLDVIRTIQSYKYLKIERKNLYIDCITSMCFHPFRPSEFLELKWEKDKGTEHLMIRGTKTQQSQRVVPLMYFPKIYYSGKNGIGAYRLSNVSLNRQLERLGLKVRTRDFRRTYSIWAEKAGIERSHLIRYLGHAGKTTTDIYQMRALTKNELTIDAEKLTNWIRAELVKGQQKGGKNWVPRTDAAVNEMFTFVALAEHALEINQMPEWDK